MGYPPKKTWLEAIKLGFYATWPGLTEGSIRKHLPEESEETAAGHLHMRQQGIQSTRKISTEPELKGKGKSTKDRKQRIGTHIVPL